MSTSASDRRHVIGGVLLAVAGAYILFEPFGVSPGGCVGSLIRFTGFVQAVSTCVAFAAPQFVASSVVGLLALVAALWMLLPGAAGSRTGSVVLAAAVLAILGTGAIAFATSPTGPFRTTSPTQTAIPVQTSGPTTRP